MYKIGVIIDKNEFLDFSKDEPNTTFLLMKECLIRGYEIFLVTTDNLFLNNNSPEALIYKPYVVDDAVKFNDTENIRLNDLDMILIRQNPPVDLNYIFMTYILDYVDQSKTIMINNPTAIRKNSEKICLNNFSNLTPKSITTSNTSLIKDFLNEYKEIVVKPLNNYAGNGIFYLKKGDKNLNSILEKITDNGRTVILAQEFLQKINNGDKRLVLLGGEPVASIIRIPYDDDFRANMCKGGYLKECEITDEDRKICKELKPGLIKEGLFFVGLDIVDNKIIEINITSPGFFIKKINLMFNIKLESRVVDYMEKLLSSRKTLTMS